MQGVKQIIEASLFQQQHKGTNILQYIHAIVLLIRKGISKYVSAVVLVW